MLPAMPYQNHIQEYPEPEIVATYSFWGFYLKVPELCTILEAEKRAAPGLATIDIFKRRKRNGLLHPDGDEVRLSLGAANLPIELWDMVQLYLVDACVQDAQRELDHQICCKRDFLNFKHADYYKAWCHLCYPIPPTLTPINPLSDLLRPASQRNPAFPKRTFCTCLVCDQDPIVHRPAIMCPTTYRFVDFEYRLLAPRGLRVACVISDQGDQEADDLFGVTLATFPELDSDVEEAMDALTRGFARNFTGSAGSDTSLSSSSREYVPPSPVFKAPSTASIPSTNSSNPNRLLTRRQLTTLERPFRRLLSDYPLLVPFYLDPKLTPDSPEVFCEYHTPLVPGYWSSQGDADEQWAEGSVWEGDEGWDAHMIPHAQDEGGPGDYEGVGAESVPEWAPEGESPLV